MKDYYKILEVNEEASDEMVGKAYKFLAKKYHPDLQSGINKEIFAKKMIEVNEAYEILGNASKRSEYNNTLKVKRQEEANRNVQNTNVNSAVNTNQKPPAAPVHIRREYSEADLSKKEISKLRRKQKKEQRRMQERAQLDYEADLRAMGYNVKHKMSILEIQRIIIAIIVLIIIVAILWIIPPSKKVMIDLYNNNAIIKFFVDAVRKLFKYNF